MQIANVREAYEDLKDTPCPITEHLIKSGYQQTGGGYIDTARENGMIVDYTQAKPSQYWHLMSYCDGRPPDQTFGKSVVCGELIFWMAEALKCVDEKTLSDLAESIILSGKPYDRKKWNRTIQDTCFEAIKKTVEGKQEDQGVRNHE